MCIPIRRRCTPDWLDFPLEASVPVAEVYSGVATVLSHLKATCSCGKCKEADAIFRDRYDLGLYSVREWTPRRRNNVRQRRRCVVCKYVPALSLLCPRFTPLRVCYVLQCLGRYRYRSYPSALPFTLFCFPSHVLPSLLPLAFAVRLPERRLGIISSSSALNSRSSIFSVQMQPAMGSASSPRPHLYAPQTRLRKRHWLMLHNRSGRPPLMPS